MDIHDHLSQKYFDYKPIQSPPSLGTFNSIGLSIYGKRDIDPETGTYVKTHVAVVLFLPVLVLGAYRVADAEDGGWYFLGKQDLSLLAKSWNVILLTVLCLFGGITYRDSVLRSPNHLAENIIEEAEQAEKEGRLGAAAERLKDVFLVEGLKRHKPAYQTARQKLVDYAALPATDPNGSAVFAVHVALLRQDIIYEPMVPNLVEVGLALLEVNEAQSPKSAHQVLTDLLYLKGEDTELQAREAPILEAWVKAEPTQMEPSVMLALYKEKHKDMEAAKNLLLPHEAALADGEGARLLGQLMMSEGQHQRALPLLNSYVSPRLARMRKATEGFEQITSKLWEEIVEDLQNGSAPDRFYSNYERAGETGQQQMVSEYVNMKMEKNTRYKVALREYQEANSIVPVVLDLGIAQLSAAQDSVDEVQRRAGFERAEETFMAIGSQMGDSGDYQLFLGQVKYWLGKYDEGQALFDEMLKSANRGTEALLTVANVLRNVGENEMAYTYAHEAFDNAGDKKTRQSIAFSLSYIASDNDEIIAWLRKADTQDAAVDIALNFALSSKAMAEGRKQEAVAFLKKTIEGYRKQPKSAASLNNTALAYQSLYQISGRIDDLRASAALMEEAITLEPDDSILIGNTLSVLTAVLSAQLVREQMGREPRDLNVDLDDLDYFYKDEAGLQAISKRVQQHPEMEKIANYQEKCLVMMPKSISSYRLALETIRFCFDGEPFEKLRTRINQADLDHTENERLYWEALKKDPKERLAGYQDQVIRWEKQLEDKGLPKVQRAMAITRLNTLYLDLDALGHGKVSADQLLANAQEAVRLAPSYSTNRAMIATHLHLAHMHLKKEEPAYATEADTCRSSLDRGVLIRLMVSRGDGLSARIAANPHVKQAVSLISALNQAIPSFRSAGDAVFFKGMPEYEIIAQSVKNDARKAPRMETYLKLAPYNASSLASAYFYYDLVDQGEKARKLYQEGRKKGAPLPALH